MQFSTLEVHYAQYLNDAQKVKVGKLGPLSALKFIYVAVEFQRVVISNSTCKKPFYIKIYITLF